MDGVLFTLVLDERRNCMISLDTDKAFVSSLPMGAVMARKRIRSPETALAFLAGVIHDTEAGKIERADCAVITQAVSVYGTLYKLAKLEQTKQDLSDSLDEFLGDKRPGMRAHFLRNMLPQR